MMDLNGKKSASWSVLVPSASHQRHYSNLERFLQCATPTAPPKFLPQHIVPDTWFPVLDSGWIGSGIKEFYISGGHAFISQFSNRGQTHSHGPIACVLSRCLSCIHDLNSLWQPPGPKDMVEYFTLGDLWDCYDEWSAYGAGTQVVLSSGETIRQYYVPYLSAIQIYSNKSVVASRNSREHNDVVELESDSWSDDSMSDKLSRSLSNNSSKTWDTISEDSSVDHDGFLSTREKFGYRSFQYFEISSPYWRVPLLEKITELARNNPGLMTLKNVDLSPASWMAVAWYPIYHIPSQGNEKGLSTCFLTYHTLSSSFQDEVNGDYDIEADGTEGKRKGEGNECISLPPFGLATYKLQGNLWINPVTSDDERMTYLESAADSWLKQLNVHHHDYNFFTSCYCTM